MVHFWVSEFADGATHALMDKGPPSVVEEPFPTMTEAVEWIAKRRDFFRNPDGSQWPFTWIIRGPGQIFEAVQ